MSTTTHDYEKGQAVWFSTGDTFGSMQRVEILKVYKGGNVLLLDPATKEEFQNNVCNLRRTLALIRNVRMELVREHV